MELPASLKAQAYALALNAIVDGKALVTQVDNGFVVTPDSAQVSELQAILSSSIFGGTTPDVQLDLSGAYMPLVYKTMVPSALGLIALGWAVGKFLL